jgi:hypothetical protein
MPSSLAVFKDAKLEIAGVKTDFADIENRIQAFFKTCRHRFFEQSDLKTNEIVFCVEFIGELPDEIVRRTTHVFQNMKHALDKAVCASFFELTGKESRHIHFPVGTSRTDLKREIDKCAKAGVKPAIVSYLTTCDACEEGNVLLWAVGRLAQIKHRRFIKAGFNQSEIRFGECGPDAKFAFKPLPGKENQFEFARLPLGSNSKADCHITLSVSLSEPPHPEGIAIDFVINDMMREVDRVISGIEIETARIKPAAP